MHRFTTVTGVYVPDVTAEVMRTIDRTTQEAFGIDLLQMMENAGRELAARLLPDLDRDASVTVVAGGGGNGGGGLACARRLHDRGVHVRVVLARPASRLVPATGHQLATLHALGVPIAGPDRVGPWVSEAAVTVDALIGYGLRSRPAPWMDHLIHAVNRCARSIVSLDVPSGLDATRGVALGAVVRPKRIVTLGLPKTGLASPTVDLSDVWLADVGLPAEAIRRAGVERYLDPFRSGSAVEMRCRGFGATRCRDRALRAGPSR